MSQWIKPLPSVRLEDLPLVGGKGANLGHLLRAGLPVPTGYCITTEAYDAVLREGDIGAVIAEALAHIDRENVQTYERASGLIESAFRQMPEPLWEQIIAAHRDLSGPVAVRSSATAEDLPGASFAGQQETVLGVDGAESLRSAVLRCFGSLWSARAIHYRDQMGFSHSAVKLSVVVQQMVPARVAGVLFTAHPVTNDRTLCVIEAAQGLGEGVVSGTANVDQYIARKGTGELEDASCVQTEHPVLDPVEVAELVAFGRQIEALYGRPQDIEWAYAGRRPFILQARPITTMEEEPQEGRAPG